MRYLLLLLTICSCTFREPRFHAANHVEVIKGFYTGCYGILVDRVSDDYVVELTCSNKETIYVGSKLVNESFLKLSDK